MNYVLPLAISLVLFTLILCSLLVFLYLQAVRQMRDSYQQQGEALAKTVEIQLHLAENGRESLESQQSEAAKSLGQLTQSLLSETVTTLESNQQQAIRTIDLMATRQMNGSQAFVQQTSDTLRSAVTLLGTKDPVAYQMVKGASLPDTDPGQPYTSVDEVAEQQARLVALDEAERYLQSMGVTPNGDTGPGPYFGAVPD